MKSRYILLTLLYHATVCSQNIIDTSIWTLGQELVSGFNLNGGTQQNERVFGENHLSDSNLLWTCIPTAESDMHGGWSTDYYAVNNSQTYRFSVWIKKTNSNSGTSYFGSVDETNQLQTLDNVSLSNAMFWSGDVPYLNRWYLMVGYVHKSSHEGTDFQGGIYDGTTGEKVIEMTDFKMLPTTVALKHHAFLNYVTNMDDRQYFYAPRMEPVNGLEPSVETLLGLNPDAKIVFQYDVSGNQTEIVYNEPFLNNAKRKIDDQDLLVMENDPYIEIYPNPAAELVKIVSWFSDGKTVETIYLVDVVTTVSVELTFEDVNRTTMIDVSQFPTGVYLLEVVFSDGSLLTNEMIKL